MTNTSATPDYAARPADVDLATYAESARQLRAAADVMEYASGYISGALENIDSLSAALLAKEQEALALRKDVKQLRFEYAGAIGLLAETAVYLNESGEGDDLRDVIERACLAWADDTKWSDVGL